MTEGAIDPRRPGVEEEIAGPRGVEAEALPAGRVRLTVEKTYKLYINGRFPRSESGRLEQVVAPSGELVANVCRSSRKDFREAVVAARAAQGPWAGRSAFNRSQILYRAAEMLEGRAAQFEAELVLQGDDTQSAAREVAASIDRLVYYAGWCDKFQQCFSSVNPVSSSHFNFSIVEPTGVVAIIAPDSSGLLGLVSVVAPALAGGNAVVALASSKRPLSAITLAEVLHTSDLPGGVANILTGRRDELLEHFASHMDVNALLYCGNDPEQIETAQRLGADNVKRILVESRRHWSPAEAQSPYLIVSMQEVKTIWHPIGS